MIRFRIFTDGGAFQKEEGFVGVSSYSLFKDNELLHEETTVHETGTNNYSEIFAIAKGLENMVKYLNVNDEIEEFIVELYTDSLLCLKSLTLWIWNWLKKAKGGIFYNASNEKVINQELIKEAFKYLQLLKGKYKIYHINSHQPLSKVKEQHKKFQKFNNTDMSFEDFMFAYMNNQKRDTKIKESYELYLSQKENK